MKKKNKKKHSAFAVTASICSSFNEEVTAECGVLQTEEVAR